VEFGAVIAAVLVVLRVRKVLERAGAKDAGGAEGAPPDSAALVP
jgi:hypothetical protein